MNNDTASDAGDRTGRKELAGAFDVRNVIAALIGFYGVVLVLMGLFANSEEDMAKTGDVNANLWAGIAMVVVGLIFFAWSWLRPVVVDRAEIERDDDEAPSAG